MKKVLIIAMLAGVAFSSCKKEKMNVIPKPDIGHITLNVGYHVDGKPLFFDSLMYTNTAGNKYSITKIHYYLSGFRMYKNDEMKYSSDTIIYVDAQQVMKITFMNMPAITYDSVSFYIGIDEENNISNSLPPTAENVNMGWPDMMGGGYHFLKLEGHWVDNNGKLGYAMHIGKNGFLVRAGVKTNMTVTGSIASDFKLMMNINQWFASPNTYNLATDGVYSMGNAVLMKKLSENGANVFTIQ